MAELQIAQQCLWFVLEPLVTKNDYFSYGFYKTLIEKMKNHKDAVRPDDDHLNYVSYNVVIKFQESSSSILLNDLFKVFKCPSSVFQPN